MAPIKKSQSFGNILKKSQSFGNILKLKRSQHKLIDNLKTEIKDLKAENECLRMCLTATSPSEEQEAYCELKLRDEKKHLQEELKKLYEEVKEIQNHLTGAGDANESFYLRNINRELTITNEELKNKLKQYEENGTAIIANVECDNKKIDELQNMVCELKKGNFDLQQKLKVALKNYQEAIVVEEKVKGLTHVIETQKMEREMFEINLANQKQKQNNLILRLDECVSSTNDQKFALQSEIHKLKMKISESDEEKQNLEYQLALYKDVNGDRKDWAKRISILESEKYHLEGLVVKLNREQDDLTDRLQTKIRDSTILEIELQSEVAKQQAKVKELKIIIKNMSSKLDETRKKITFGHSLARRDSGLELDIVHLEFEKKALLDEKENLIEENKKLLHQINELRKEFKVTQEYTRNIITGAYNEYKKTFYVEGQCKDRDEDDLEFDPEKEIDIFEEKLESCIKYIETSVEVKEITQS